MRASVTKAVVLSNPTDAPWQLRPIIQNDFWSGPEHLRVGGHSARLRCACCLLCPQRRLRTLNQPLIRR